MVLNAVQSITALGVVWVIVVLVLGPFLEIGAEPASTEPPVGRASATGPHIVMAVTPQIIRAERAVVEFRTRENTERALRPTAGVLLLGVITASRLINLLGKGLKGVVLGSQWP